VTRITGRTIHLETARPAAPSNVVTDKRYRLRPRSGRSGLARHRRPFTDHCRDGDLLARVGGEEFAVILHGLGIAGALAIAERLRNGVAAQPVRYSIGGTNGQVAVTVSVGVSTFPEHGGTPEKILEAADHALYAAKSAGRNRVELAATSPGTAATDERSRPLCV